MTGFNFLSHGSQDLYPVYLTNDKLLSSGLASKATIIGELIWSVFAGRKRMKELIGRYLHLLANCGAVVGGIIAGYSSQYLGRRLA
jgi:MFS transporter, SHS family, lactate transporter